MTEDSLILTHQGGVYAICASRARLVRRAVRQSVLALALHLAFIFGGLAVGSLLGEPLLRPEGFAGLPRISPMGFFVVVLPFTVILLVVWLGLAIQVRWELGLPPVQVDPPRNVVEIGGQLAFPLNTLVQLEVHRSFDTEMARHCATLEAVLQDGTRHRLVDGQVRGWVSDSILAVGQDLARALRVRLVKQEGN